MFIPEYGIQQDSQEFIDDTHQGIRGGTNHTAT